MGRKVRFGPPLFRRGTRAEVGGKTDLTELNSEGKSEMPRGGSVAERGPEGAAEFMGSEMIT